MKDEKLEWAFRLYDIDNDGLITKKEMVEVIQSMMSLVENSKNFESDISAEEEVQSLLNH